MADKARNASDKPSSRLRWDLAHELGHLVMHAGKRTGDKETESQADIFAGAFLLPRRALLREFPRRDRIDWASVFALKQRWGVSVAAVVRGAYRLGLVSELQQTSAFKYISFNGWRKREPGEPPQERPEAVMAAFQALEDDGVCPVARTAAAVNVSEELVLESTGHVYEPRRAEPAPMTQAPATVLDFAAAKGRLRP